MLNRIKAIHAQNKSVGWWDEVRPFSTFACLFHSELSEAMEGDRKNLMDDHLPEYSMFKVELADFVIRVMDWLGSVDASHVTHAMALTDDLRFDDNCALLAELHWSTSHAYETTHNLDTSRTVNQLVTAIKTVENHLGDELWEIVDKKVEYNKTRADHKRENRAKSDGKKY